MLGELVLSILFADVRSLDEFASTALLMQKDRKSIQHALQFSQVNHWFSYSLTLLLP